MTPPAATSAARTRATRRAASPVPRRVSGPAGGRSAAARAGTVALPRPTRRTTTARPAKRRPGTAVAVRALRTVRTLPDHQLLDRIVRGRAWIPLLGLLLAGIVAMQVEVLKLGASIGRSIETGSALESRNELLRASVATLSDDQRIERLAAAQGMVMPAPEQIGFLTRHRGGDVGRGLANIHPPNPASFSMLISPNGAVVTGNDQATSGQQLTQAAQVPVQTGSTQALVQTQSQTPVQTQTPSQTTSGQGATAAPAQTTSTSGG